MYRWTLRSAAPRVRWRARRNAILPGVNWLEEHQILLAGLLLILLTLIGLAFIAARTVTLMRTTKTARRAVEPPVAAISEGLADAERRVGVIADGQADLEQTIERVGARAGELRVLVDHAGRALSVLRAPFKYFGK